MTTAPTTRTKGWQAAERDADVTVLLPGDLPIFFRRIPAAPQGFLMGSRHGDDNEEPAHRVVMPSDFWIATFPLTQAQWRSVVKEFKEFKALNAPPALGTQPSLNPSPSTFTEDGDDRPVETVSWADAVAWCEALGTLKVRGHDASGTDFAAVEFRLPNEAEWEYACRAGTETEYSLGEGSGDGEAALREVGWFEGNAKGATHPVGELAANGFGLYDMHGNVYEWCADVWDAKAYRKRGDGWAGRAWELADAGADAEFQDDADRSRGAAFRVFRGGSWIDSAWYCRSSYRYGDWPDYRGRILGSERGFRVCLVRGPSELASMPAEA
mgnify:CR=1 FL=1